MKTYLSFGVFMDIYFHVPLLIFQFVLPYLNVDSLGNLRMEFDDHDELAENMYILTQYLKKGSVFRRAEKRVRKIN